MIAETQNKPANASTLREYGADLESLRDEWAMLDGYRTEIGDIVVKMKDDAGKRGYAREQIMNAAEALESAVSDEIKPAIWLLECAIYDQGGHHG